MSEELKPCPFCGGEAHIERMGSSRVSMIIECDHCGCGMETGETWIDERSEWNNRATDDQADRVKELEEGLKTIISLAYDGDSVANQIELLVEELLK